jgi:hypothetical protein
MMFFDRSGSSRDRATPGPTSRRGHIGHKAANWSRLIGRVMPSLLFRLGGTEHQCTESPAKQSSQSCSLSRVSISRHQPREEVLFCAFVPPSPSRGAPGRLMARPVAPSQKNRAPTLTLSIGVEKDPSHHQVGTKHWTRASLSPGSVVLPRPPLNTSLSLAWCSTARQPSGVCEISAENKVRIIAGLLP